MVSSYGRACGLGPVPSTMSAGVTVSGPSLTERSGSVTGAL
jgi:hypothetical protein